MHGAHILLQRESYWSVLPGNFGRRTILLAVVTVLQIGRPFSIKLNCYDTVKTRDLEEAYSKAKWRHIHSTAFREWSADGTGSLLLCRVPSVASVASFSYHSVGEALDLLHRTHWWRWRRYLVFEGKERWLPHWVQSTDGNLFWEQLSGRLQPPCDALVEGDFCV